MSSGALLELVAVGAMDAYLKIDPDLNTPSFFRTAYRRHTPFAVATLEIDLPGVGRGFGEKTTIQLPRKGDMITGLFLQVTMRKGSGTAWYPGQALLEETRVEIGSQLIDIQTSEWAHLKSQLFFSASEHHAYRRLVDFTDGEAEGTLKTFYVPLTHFFCSPGKALPLIALSMHTASLTFKFADSVKGIDMSFTPEIKLFAQYVMLSESERRILAQTPFEMLVEQLQIQEERIVFGRTPSTYRANLLFKNPCKYLVVACSPPNTYAKYAAGVEGETSETLAPLSQIALEFSGHERFNMPAQFFNTMLPYTTLKSAPPAGIYFLPFAHDPKAEVPTGSANFSAISAPVLTLQLKGVNPDIQYASQVSTTNETVSGVSELSRARLYAVNWNILRFTGGLSSLAFVN